MARGFTVTVLPDHDLAMAQPADISTTTSSPSGKALLYPLPAVTDEDSATIHPVCTPAPLNTFPVGATTVTCTAADSADSNSPVTTSFTVTVTFVPVCNLTITAYRPGMFAALAATEPAGPARPALPVLQH